jgi:hypothetical protein
MSIWIVRARWFDSKADINEFWEVNAASASEAVRTVSEQIHFPLHHVEARHRDPQIDGGTTSTDLALGEARRVPPQQ